MDGVLGEVMRTFPNSLRLKGARVALNATKSETADLLVHRGRIVPTESGENPALTMDLSGHLILPGLINAHDHLEFSLFPRLGNGPYPNASAWAADIYRPLEEPIKEHLRVPKSARLLWGGLKNLLSGVTTVSHHNPCEAELFGNGFPVRVVKQFGWAHSFDFSPDLVERYRKTPPRWPFIVHAGEGTDSRARSEIYRLDQAGVLGHRTVLVHAVALDGPGCDLIRTRRASIVWCPSSNRFTVGQTLKLNFLGSGVPIALGSDSSLTSMGDLIDEIAIARRSSGLGTDALYEMVTRQAARILRLRNGEGGIRTGGVADLLIVRDRGQCPADSLLRLRPELVLARGVIQLISPRLARQLPASLRSSLHPIELGYRGRWLVNVDVRKLYDETTAILGGEIRLGGKRVQA